MVFVKFWRAEGFSREQLDRIKTEVYVIYTQVNVGATLTSIHYLHNEIFITIEKIFEFCNNLDKYFIHQFFSINVCHLELQILGGCTMASYFFNDMPGSPKMHQFLRCFTDYLLAHKAGSREGTKSF